MEFQKIISGGQTGVDRAALDVALTAGVRTGGWCPNGRIAEDGILPECYILKETPQKRYSQRTEWNVRDSDGTLILSTGPLTGGTAFTLKVAKRLKKPCLVININDFENRGDDVFNWIKEYSIETLNIAGPRETSCPGIYKKAYGFLLAVICQT